MKVHWKIATMSLTLFIPMMLFSGCSGSSGPATPVAAGKVSVDLTDAPAIDFAHVYVTVTGVAFHTDATASFSNFSSGRTAGWQSVTLSAPRTVDLARLTDGTMFADDNGGASLFSDVTLPVGRYQQIRIFLASSEDAYVGSESGLTFNNEVVLNGDATHYPLRIPTADEGIRLVPEAPVVVTDGGSLKLALDFNLNNDIVEISPNGTREFILKPRLGFFDMGSVGAVTGTIGFPNLSTSRFAIKAQQVKSGAGSRVVRRITAVDKTTGEFTLYPLPVFGNATTAVYDILIRGRNVQTAIVKGVTVHRGTTPTAGAIDLGTITMQPGTEFTAQLGTGMHPSGAWLNFCQTIAGDPVPYEVRYRHLDPFTGKMGRPIELPTGPVQVASFTPGQPLSFAADTTSQGVFSVVADAQGLYGKGAALNGVTGASGQPVVMTMSAANNPQVGSPATAATISGVFDMTLMGTGRGNGMGMGNRPPANPTKGEVLVTHGGMIVDSLGVLTGDTTVSAAMHAGGGEANPVAMGNLPGGVPGAVYGMYALGWGNGTLEAGSAHGIDLRKGNATATIRMK